MDSRGSRGWLAFTVSAALFCTALITAAQTPSSPKVTQEKPTFTVQVALVTTDVLVRDRDDHFVPDLHLGALDTASVRDLFKQIQKTLLHDGDMFAIVSSGPSSLHIDLTYDLKRFEEEINRITGNGLRPSEIVQSQTGADGPAELRYRTQVAFSTVKDALAGLEKVHNRRKAFVYVSEGYDLIPFAKSRACDPATANQASFQQNDVACLQNMVARQGNSGSAHGQGQQAPTPANIRGTTGEEFADAELARQLIELTKDADRANTTFYAIDP